MIIKDAMVIIHLAKITLLEKSCEYFKNVIVPKMVYHEVLAGKDKGQVDVKIFTDLIKINKIKVKEIKDKDLIKKEEEFNIQRGEAEALALYWQEESDYLATDDDNVRKKSIILGINLIGTLPIILKLYKEKLIKKDKFEESLNELRKIGWFNDIIIDKILMEGLEK